MSDLKLLTFILLFQVSLSKAQDAPIVDWPNLTHFREANEKLKQEPVPKDRVVFMGNSITEGWVSLSPAFFAAKPYLNRGIGGQTSPQMLLRFRADVIDLKPKIVVLLCGTNDIAGNTGPSTLEMIEDNIASMAELANAHGIKVILSSVLPVYDYPWKPGLQPAEKIIALNHWIENYAKKNKFGYVDYFSSMANEQHGLKQEYSIDGVHPNKAGYAVMEKLLQVVIKKQMD